MFPISGIELKILQGIHLSLAIYKLPGFHRQVFGVNGLGELDSPLEDAYVFSL